ncbi:CBS domain-containing protein [Shouchella shacheensis]|uniref:CBS domain-containing protein n=1 Tax=Shouchella shacheensis TaxID=1649580 RepID=UPI0007401E05|nr:CBS domain-containing protein [Shouchella shacheensis]
MNVIVSHTNLDFDALASLVAAKRLFPDALCVLPHAIKRQVRAYLALYKDSFPFTPFNEVPWQKVSDVVLVDASSDERCGLSTTELPADVQRTIIDHHLNGDSPITASSQIEAVGACTTLLIERMRTAELAISEVEATLFAIGLYTDTALFTFEQTTSRDLEAAAYLHSLSLDSSTLRSFATASDPVAERPLFHSLLADLEMSQIGDLRIAFASGKQDDFEDGVSTMVETFLDTHRADACVVCVQMAKDVYIIGRASSERIDLRLLMKPLGGGGHAGAGAATAKNTALAEVVHNVKNNLSQIVLPPLEVQYFMNWPVMSLIETTSIEEAYKESVKHGHSGFPVMNEEGALSGVVSRRDMDKALHLGYGHAPIKGYMTHDVITIAPDASLEEATQTMIDRSIGRLPVLNKQGELLGIVTRTNVIERSQRSDKPAKNLTERLKEDYSDQTIRLLKEIGEEADRQNASAFLVGGVVRDLFLQRENDDIDIVVEGDAIHFAKQLARSKGGAVSVYEHFGTATWRSPHGTIDFVTARSEHYEHPGALPSVVPSSIQKDLERRDFTINAMAMYINASRLGEMIDIFCGQQDLKNQQIRVLHPLSFIEDPTRIFRAVRFALRLDYTLEEQTAELAKSIGAPLKRISPKRLMRELDLLAKEDMLYEGFIELERLDIWKSFFPSPPSPQAFCHMEHLHQHQLIDPFLFLLALAEKEQNLETLERYAETKESRQLLSEYTDTGWHNVTPDTSATECHQLLSNVSATSIRFVALKLEAGRSDRLLSYLEQRTARLSRRLITGASLKVRGLKPGPTFAEVLFAAECAQLEGVLKSEEDVSRWLDEQLS